MTNTLLTVLLGLLASLFWGSGDFCGGLASRRIPALVVVISAYAIGFLLLVGLALLWHEAPPSGIDIVWGIFGGLAGGSGLIAFYAALARGRMGIVAPVSAVLTAGLPVLFSILTLGTPGLLQIVGFVVALLAIILISRPERTHGRPKGLGLALISGCCFGLFFILLSRVDHASTFWPLSVARLSSVVFLLLLALFRRENVRPKRSAMWLILGSGCLDALGNAFFVLAAHTGRLDVASVLSSLYPAATVILAALFLRERVNAIQGLGIVLALLAIPLISLT